MLKHAFLQKYHVAIDLLILSSLWILAVVLVNPSGNFPLNDDWAYGKTVKHLLETGVFQPIDWITMSLFSQAWWGMLFCLPFGFSFTALRFSTLSLALLGVLVSYLLFKQVGAPRYLAFTASLLLAANPIYFALSHTFMTDAPFTTFTILTLFFLIRSLQNKSDANLVVGALLAAVGILCRQLGLLWPVAFVPAYLLKYGLSFPTLIRASLPLLVSLGALLGFENWLNASAGLPALYGSKTSILLNKIVESPSSVLLKMLENGLKTLIYMGLFLLPLMTLLPTPFRRKKNLLSGIILIFAVVATLVISLQGKLMPLLRNILIGGGIGPVTLRDVYILELPHAPTLPLAFWLPVTGLGILSGGLILAYIVSIVKNICTAQDNFKDNNNRLITTFLLGVGIIYSLPIIASDCFDRYLLPLIPILGMVIVIPAKTVLRRRFLLLVPNLQIGNALAGETPFRVRWKQSFQGNCVPKQSVGTRGLNDYPAKTVLRQWFGSIVVVVMALFLYALFSIAGTRDYLAWNRTRWVALQTLTERDHISPAEIDGGYEFNGWHLYNPDYSPVASKSWWWVDDDHYLVTMGAVDGYEVFRRYQIERWLPPGETTIFILRRKNLYERR